MCHLINNSGNKLYRKLVIILCCILITLNSTAQNAASVDTSFNCGAGPDGSIYDLKLQRDGKIIASGGFNYFNGIHNRQIVRLNSNGTLDPTFNTGIGNNWGISSVEILKNSQLLIGGSFTTFNGIPINGVARLNTDGSRDTSFHSGLIVNDEVLCSKEQLDGKLIVGGRFTTYNGVLANRIARLNSDGSLDTSFNTGIGANDILRELIIQPDNKIIVVGNFTSFNGNSLNRIVRLNPNGSLDATFTPGTGTNNSIITASLRSDGKIMIGGLFTSFNGITRKYIARLNSDGTLDLGFDSSVGANYLVKKIAIQSDGLLVAGNFTTYNGVAKKYLVRLFSDGTIDGSFLDGTGLNGLLYNISVQNDGKILLGGAFTMYDGISCNTIVRLIGGPIIQSNPTCLVSNYSFTGNSADNSGNGNNGNIFGTSLTNDRFGNPNSAIQFNGDSDFVSIAQSPFINDIPFSITAWINIDSLNAVQPIVSMGCNGDSTLNELCFGLDSTQHLCIFTNGLGNITSSNGLVASNQWVHVAVVRTAGGIAPSSCKFFINGISYSANAQAGNLPTIFNNYASIGRSKGNSHSNFFSGKMDEIGIYNCSLSDSAVMALYQRCNAILIQPANVNVNMNTNAVFSLTTAIAGSTFQWQSNSGTGFTNLTNGGQFTGVDNDTLIINNVSLSQNNLQLRCIISLGGCSDISVPAILTVNCIQTASIVKDIPSLCQNYGVLLHANTGSGLSYQWKLNGANLTGATTNTYRAQQTGNYTVNVSNGTCSALSSVTAVSINALQTKGELCIVSVDSASGKNIIIWEQPIFGGVDSFYVYKESSTSNVYTRIGASDANNFSTFIDQSSIPQQKAEKYVLSLVDTCGFEYLKSDPHKTIHLSINQGLGGVLNLIWDNYLGFSYSTYYILRGSLQTGFSVIDSVSSGITSYSDLNPPLGIVYYAIEVRKSIGCSPSARMAIAPYTASKSNIQNYLNVAATEIQAESYEFKISPNPISSRANISFSLLQKENIVIQVTDLTGRIIKTIANESFLPGVHKLEWDATNDIGYTVSNGIYFIRIDSGRANAVKKIAVYK